VKDRVRTALQGRHIDFETNCWTCHTYYQLQRWKRPIIVSKEAYTSVKRGLY